MKYCGDALVNLKPYQSMVGSQMYAMLYTRLDIAYVNLKYPSTVCSYSNSPIDWQARDSFQCNVEDGKYHDDSQDWNWRHTVMQTMQL